jgi:hypothetical protein
MKKVKFLLIMCVLLLVSTTMFAAVDSTMVTTTTTYSLTFLFKAFGSYISAHIWATVFTIAFIISEVMASVKWIPKNSICQILWYVLKAVADFFANKKTSGDTTEKTTTETTEK